jgi:acetyl esterase/lipase
MFNVNPENLATVRAGVVQTMAPPSVVSDDRVEVARLLVPGQERSVELEVLVYRPRHRTGPIPGILQVHGGGYVIGLAAMGDGQNRRLAAELDCIVVAVEYRLAPEARFPAPVEDCYAALTWMHSNAATLGIDPTRIAIMGESAGGGLAASLAFLVRDRKTVPVIFLTLIYPMLDDRTGSGRDPGAYAGEYVWTREANRFGWTSLLGRPAGGQEIPYPAAPARIENLAGLPPTFIAVGTLDLFATEGIRYAERLVEHGVPTELHVYPGAFHGFDQAEGTRVATQFATDRRRALQRAFDIMEQP